MCNERYASEIAERWNARDGGRGYVLRFKVESRFLAKYELRVVGASYHQEYWIPAEEIDALNSAIVGPIEVVGRYEHAREG